MNVGDRVFVKSLGVFATVLEIRGDELLCDLEPKRVYRIVTGPGDVIPCTPAKEMVTV